ncbi:MAG: acetylglutamate kinase [Firmicutes bacterium]|nr:acetylglutamate kinase [Bacillota bacterium]
MYEEAKKKAAILVEALPYIQRFQGKIVVIKYGGNAMINEELKQAVFQDVVLMKLVGMNPVLVHGGGPEISDMLKRLGKETRFVNGLRYTDQEVMEIAEMVLVGKINKEIVAGMNYYGASALGMCGKDGGMVMAEKYMPVVYDKEGNESLLDIGYVGKVTKVDNQVLLDVISQGYIPVIAPIGVGDDQQTYNINADFMAGEIASSLKADKFVLLTDTEGIYESGINGDKKIFKSLHIDDTDQLIKGGIISGGMIPKINCCVDALENGVERVHIIDGRVPHSILLEIFTNEGIGTMIIK